MPPTRCCRHVPRRRNVDRRQRDRLRPRARLLPASPSGSVLSTRTPARRAWSRARSSTAVTAAAAEHGLRFGPDPSTHARATVGGIIGNNACGSRALGYGRTADNVVDIDVLTATGVRFTARGYGRDGFPAPEQPEVPMLAALDGIVRDRLGMIRTEFGRFGRQVSGYSLEHLLPEHGFDVARFLVGSEGTLGVVTRATVRLAPAPAAVALVVLGYADMASRSRRRSGAVAAPTARGRRPRRPLGRCRRSRRGGGGARIAARQRMAVRRDAGGHHSAGGGRCRAGAHCGGRRARRRVVTDAAAAALWRIREDGAGWRRRTPAGAAAGRVGGRGGAGRTGSAATCATSRR